MLNLDVQNLYFWHLEVQDEKIKLYSKFIRKKIIGDAGRVHCCLQLVLIVKRKESFTSMSKTSHKTLQCFMSSAKTEGINL